MTETDFNLDCLNDIQESNYRYPKYDKEIYAKIHQSNRQGIKIDEKELYALSGTHKIPFDKLKELAEHIYEDNKDEWGFDDMSEIEKTEVFLSKHYEFRQDIISKLAEMRKRGGKWEALNNDTVHRHMQKNYIKFSLDKLKSLLKSDYVKRYNPFEDYFNNLPKWDGEDHISQLTKHFRLADYESEEFFMNQFKKAMVRSIQCALIPDFYNRIVFTIISENQEIGKSWFFQWLNPWGSSYYSDETLSDNKDSRFALTENFMYNLEELDNLSKMDLGKLKATISTRGVKERLPYASVKEYFPRCCSFWGSTNRQDFLVDDKNTRWLCFYVNDIDWSYSENINKTQLWAQAWALFNDGFDSSLTKEECAIRDNNNKKYEQQDFLTSVILRMFTKDNTGQYFLDNAEIMQLIVQNTERLIQFPGNNAVSIGRTLGRLGFKKGTSDGRRGWFIKLKPAEDKEKLPF